MLVVETRSEDETRLLGKKLGSLLCPGDVICVKGDLGAGKTRLAQGVARGLGIEEPVTSPTFTLINEYAGRVPFYHIDAYRLGGPDELREVGCEEYFYGDGVTLLEWPDRVSELLPAERLDVEITYDPARDGWRRFSFVPRGGRYVNLVEELVTLVRAGD